MSIYGEAYMITNVIFSIVIFLHPTNACQRGRRSLLPVGTDPAIVQNEHLHTIV